MRAREISKFVLDQSPRQVLHFLRRKLSGRARLSGFDDSHRCVFTLSTGRVGTETLAGLFELTDGYFVYHEPVPILYGLSKSSYEYGDHPLARRLLGEAFSTSRKHLLDYSLDCGQGYIETSPQVTFLAPVILDVIPSARFIFLVRSPRDVIRSAMRRKWYDGHRNDPTRITPVVGSPAGKQWETYTLFEKNLWLWTETNRWIMQFASSLPSHQILFLHSEDLFTGDKATVEKLFDFVGRQPASSSAIRKVLGKRMNAQLTGEFPEASAWTSEMNQSFSEIAGEIAGKLGYGS